MNGQNIPIKYSMKFRIPLPNFKLMIAVASISATAWAYVVKEGDTLSTIAYKNISKKVYGDSGSLKKIIALNPQIKNPNFITPGEEISIGETQVPVLAKSEDLNRSIAGEAEPVVAPEKVCTEIASEKAPLFESGATMELTPDYSLTGLKTTDRSGGATITLPSQTNVGATLKYFQNWTQDSRSFIRFRLGYLAFSPVEFVNTKNPNHVMAGFGIGGEFDLSSRTRLALGVNYQQEAFGSLSTATDITIDSAAIPNIDAKLSYNFFDKKPFVFGVSGVATVYFPVSVQNYTSRLGESFGGILYMKQQSVGGGTMSYQTEVGFTTRRQSTSLSDLTQTDVTVGVRIFFGNQKSANKEVR
jgi:LysM repeat protein